MTAEQQVGQLVAGDHLTLLDVTNRRIDLLGPQEITLRTSAKSSAVRRQEPIVVEGEVVTRPPCVSPLDADESGRYPTSLRGGVVTDPAEIGQIRARVERGRWSR